MKFFGNLALGLVALALAAGQTTAAENYQLEASHTSVIFGVSHMGYSYTYGRFNKVNGSYVLDRANPGGSKFALNISVDSIDTNDAKRDVHLKSPDFFNASQFPVISFDSTKVAVEKSDKGTFYNVTGNLTMHGVTKEITLPLKMLGEGKGMQGEYRTGFYLDTRLKRSEWGMANMVPAIGDEIAITISFEGVRQEAAPASGSGTR